MDTCVCLPCLGISPWRAVHPRSPTFPVWEETGLGGPRWLSDGERTREAAVHSHTAHCGLSCAPAEVEPHLLPSPAFLQDAFVRVQLPRLLWVKRAQEKAQHLQVQISPPMRLDGPGEMALPRCFPPPSVQPGGQPVHHLGCEQSPCRQAGPLEMGQLSWRWTVSPWRQALTRWPQSCPCPSPRSSGRGRPSLQAAPRRSNNNPPGS